jgi:hypothetical protein
MLCLLLDEHLSSQIVKQFLVKCPGSNMASVLEWQDGRLVGAPDELLLAEAHRHKLTLVTYDQATIVPLLKSWAEQGIPHTGVIFIDDRTIRPDDFGGIVRALAQLWQKERNEDWLNRAVYLTRPAAT